MPKSALEIAKDLIKRRNFTLAIKVLESSSRNYHDDFDYYVTLGIALLYAGIPGEASEYFDRARRIKINDIRLLLGQAAVFLHRGNLNRAMDYYLDITRDLDPKNKTAHKGLDFIRSCEGVNTNLHNCIDSGRIRKFYPPLPVNPNVIAGSVFAFIGAILIAVCCITFIPRAMQKNQARKDLAYLLLTEDERKNPNAQDLNESTVRYILSNKQINETSDLIVDYLGQNRDNMAQVEINRILSSNASLLVKKKARSAMNVISGAVPPTFDTLKDNFEYETVVKDSLLYIDCNVIWSGRFSNPKEYPDGSFQCDLLVGYETLLKYSGTVHCYFKFNPRLDSADPVKILGKIGIQDGNIILNAISVYQPLRIQ